MKHSNKVHGGLEIESDGDLESEESDGDLESESDVQFNPVEDPSFDSEFNLESNDSKCGSDSDDTDWRKLVSKTKFFLLLGKAALVCRNFSLAKRVEFHMACEDWDKVTST